jgi:hypothetical protein
MVDAGRGSLPMQPGLLGQQLVLGFFMSAVRDTAIHRTNGCALWLIVEALALGAFIRNDIVEFIGYWLIFSIGVYLRSGVGNSNGATQCGFFCIRPLLSRFINGMVRAFGDTGIAVDAFIGDNDSHGV